MGIQAHRCAPSGSMHYDASMRLTHHISNKVRDALQEEEVGAIAERAGVSRNTVRRLAHPAHVSACRVDNAQKVMKAIGYKLVVRPA